MKRIIRLALWLLLVIAIVPLGSCAQLALLSPTTQNTALAIEEPVAVVAPEGSLEVIINVAPTPTPTPLDLSEPTAMPAPVATATARPRATLVAQPLATSDCNSNGQLVRAKWPSDVFGKPHEYAIYLPPCYDIEGNKTKYPVIYLLHGWP
ncbi:MAG: hypothetical protein HY870_00880, partial [Chloroflexi bacterium]|nr:hypothetical protein [Chloroflexota bacterium]